MSVFGRTLSSYLPAIGGCILGTSIGVAQFASIGNCETNKTVIPTADAAVIKQVRDFNFYQRNRDLRLFSGTANVELATEIARKLKTKLSRCHIQPYADGEIGIQILENVRGKDVYIIQPTCPPGGINNNLMELILMISTMRRASAQTITAVLPYYGYARQDRKNQSRVPISAADVARLLESMGVDRVIAVDLHCGQIQGFFGPRTPCDNLNGALVALPYFQKLGLQKCVVVSPDAGGVFRAKSFRDKLNELGVDSSLAMIVKQRVRAGVIGQMDLVGDVEGCDCVIVDDMIDTAGTLCKAGEELSKRGARRVFAFATHGLFNGPAIERVENSCFDKVIVTNSVPLTPEKKNASTKIEQISIAGLLAKAIYSVHFKCSISDLFRLHEGEHPVDRATSHLEQMPDEDRNYG